MLVNDDRLHFCLLREFTGNYADTSSRGTPDTLLSNVKYAAPANIAGSTVRNVNALYQPKTGTAWAIINGARNQARHTANDPVAEVAVARMWVGNSSPMRGIRIDSDP